MVTTLDSSPKLQDNCAAYPPSYLVGTGVLSMWIFFLGGGEDVDALKLLRHETDNSPSSIA
jgi:hypothetical protein